MSQRTITKKYITELFNTPFLSLMNMAHQLHLKHHSANEIEACAIMSIKTGACPEDCNYCGQSGHFKTGVNKEKLCNVEDVLVKAKLAKKNGCTRFCMGAAWRSPPKKDLPKVIEIIKAVKELGLETCVTLGMLSNEQVEELEAAGLDYYNHNVDTSPEYYKKITTTRNYQDRVDTVNKIAKSKVNVCCGGIVGMGESREDRIDFLLGISKLSKIPKSVPINHLSPARGTPLANEKPLDSFEFIKTIAIARILFPQSMVRLSAGRDKMSKEVQAWCFFAGANSLWFAQDKIFVSDNPDKSEDTQFFEKLGLNKKIITNKDSVAYEQYIA